MVAFHFMKRRLTPMQSWKPHNFISETHELFLMKTYEIQSHHFSAFWFLINLILIIIILIGR